MTPGIRTLEPAAARSIRRTIGRIGVGVAVTVTVATSLLSAATVWLLLTKPLAVADALGQRQLADVVQAFAGLVFSLVRSLVSYL